MATQYDIFISYRRESGEDKARILNQFLSSIGYRVFFDHESGLTGEFETEILAAVEIAPVFLVLMTPNCFDRCFSEGDWVRREIEHAEKLDKTIIPIRPNYDKGFDKFPDHLPESIRKLAKLQFAEIDFHRHFKATAGTMVEEQIKKVVQPSLFITKTGDKGAKIHFFSDISCRVLHFGTPIAVTDAADTTTGSIVRLLKGRHLLEYKSIEHEADAYSETYTVVDNDYEDFVNIKLQPIKEQRKEIEEKQKAELERKAAEERERKKREHCDNDSDKYDFYFCYSRHDASIVRQAYHFLKGSGYRCWIDTEDLTAGMFIEEILTGIKLSKCILYFSSEHSNHHSEWAKKELIYAIKNKKKILPIKLDDTYSDELMYSNIPYLELKQQEDMYKLLDAVKEML